MKILGNDSSTPTGWGGQDADAATTAVRSDEGTLSQVALRLGVKLEDLKSANPHIGNPESLTRGMEIRIPPQAAGDQPAATAADGASEGDAASANSKRMESNLDASIMRAMFALGGSSRGAMPADVGTGGITHQAPVADPVRGEGYSSQTKKETLDGLRKVYDSPEFKDLNAADKKYILDTLSTNPPLTQEKINNTLELLGSAQGLSPTDRKLVMTGLRAAHADPAYAANLKKLIEDPKFMGMSDAEKTAVLSQVKNYADARSVANVERMLQKDWFAAQDLGDKQRSLKTIARLSQNRPNTDQKIIDNTLEKFIGAGSDYKLHWKTYPVGDELFYGEGGDKTLHLNKGLVSAGNDKMAENEDTDHLTLNTVSHEVNHLINGDRVADTFHYFEAEYRAWYVGFQAQNGRVPTNQEAIDQRIKLQFNPESFYGKHAAEAMKDPAEAQKFYDFIKSITGKNVDASNWQAVLNSDPVSWPNLSESPAPVPPGNIDNH